MNLSPQTQRELIQALSDVLDAAEKLETVPLGDDDALEEACAEDTAAVWRAKIVLKLARSEMEGNNG